MARKTDLVKMMSAAIRGWEALKVRGGYTIAEIDAIDANTPAMSHEPAWWLEMMEARKAISDRSAKSSCA